MGSPSAGFLESSDIGTGRASLIKHSCKLALDFHRSRAPNILIAVLTFLRAILPRLKQLVGLGADQAQKLIKLELACAYAGLGFPSKDTALGPPWWLPTDFLGLPLVSLPAHPLIDPRLLAELCENEFGHQPSTDDALQMLLSPQSLEARWSDLPLFVPNSSQKSGSARIAICLHLYYPELWPEIASHLATISEPWDLYVSIPEFACTPALSQIVADHSNIRFLPCPNRGRDVLPFIRLLRSGVFDHYDVVCKLHSKRSPHMQDGERWRRQLLKSLLGDKEQIANSLQLFRNNPRLGLLGPTEALVLPGSPSHGGSNKRVLNELANRIGISGDNLDRPFFAGTMFWFRPAAFHMLRMSSLDENDFPLEMKQTDGTLAHALERLIWPLVEHTGYNASSN